MKTIKVASTQFDLRATTPDEFWQRVESLCKSAQSQGARVILFPEYFSLSYFVAKSEGVFAQALKAWSRLQTEFCQEFRRLAKELNLVIVAGTVPLEFENRMVNRSHVFTPAGEMFFQDKRFMTRFEDEEWKIQSGAPDVLVFEVDGCKFGIAICFDVEFPSYVEDLVKKEVDVILVPSCTDDVHGYWRVRHCSEARAIETQSYVVVSYVVGGDPRFSEINGHYGRAVFATPCDIGFPEGGCLAEGQLNQEGVTVVELNLESLARVRKNGTVLNQQILKAKIQ